MAVGRYYIVNPTTKKLVMGPFRLDSADVAGWPTPPNTQVVTEAAVLADGGYTIESEPLTPYDIIRAKALAALVNNAQYLAIGAPTGPQSIVQVTKLTRQVNALIRIVLNQVDDTSDS